MAARKLLRRDVRATAGRFLVEGAQAVRESIGWAAEHPGGLVELFVTGRAAARYPDLLDAAAAVGSRVSIVSERAAASISETNTPQGIVAVCRTLLTDVDLAVRDARLVAVLADVADPGNAGTVVRVADAAGADAVLFAGDCVDPHNGKAVRSSAGSVFHLPMAGTPDVLTAVRSCRAAGLRILAADGSAGADLDDAAGRGQLDGPAAWVFGSESHGLAADVLRTADAVLAVPLYGRAESLNLATAAAVCLYRSAWACRRTAAINPRSSIT